MRAAQRIRIGKGGRPPAFAPVVLLGEVMRESLVSSRGVARFVLSCEP
jgi:hypothetical protein